MPPASCLRDVERAVKRAIALTLSFCFVACASSPPPAPEPKQAPAGSTAPSADSSDPDAALASARAELNRALGPAVTVNKGPSKSPTDQAAGGAPRTDACTTACRALTNMERAAKRLCEMAGDGD